MKKQRAENCGLLVYYAASSGNFLPKFRVNLSVPTSEYKNQEQFKFQKCLQSFSPEPFAFTFAK